MWPRIEHYMMRTGKTWEQVAKVLGVSTPAMSQWKTNKTKPSKKAIFRLEQAEREAGILPPIPPPKTPPLAPEWPPLKNSTISEKGTVKGDELLDIAGLLREAAERLEAYHRGRKGK